MNYDDLILKDRFYLVILIITITYSNKNFQLKWNCSECQTANGHHLEMDSIFISDVKEDLDSKEIQKLVDGTNFIYHPVTIKKRREAIELVEESDEYDVQYYDSLIVEFQQEFKSYWATPTIMAKQRLDSIIVPLLHSEE